MSLIESLGEGISVNKGNTKDRFIVVFIHFFNIMSGSARNTLRRHKCKLPVLYKMIANWFLCFDLDHSELTKSLLRKLYGQRLVVNGVVIFSHDVTMRHHAIICSNANRGTLSVIGSNIGVGENSHNIDAVQIGNNIVICTGSVVVNDIADVDVVFGNSTNPIHNKVRML